MSAFGRRLITVFGSAVILLFFSEFYFLNEGPVLTITEQLTGSPALLVFSLLEFTLFYALFAYIFLIAVQIFQVSTWLDLILAGALFGWATEALLVPVAYEAVPISLIFPSVSWHALVDVFIGWYAVRRVLRMNNLLLSVGLFLGLGAVWGAWATWFWAEPDLLAPLPPETFTAFAFVTGIFWLSGMAVLDRFGATAFKASRWEIGFVMLITLGLFVLMAVPFLPFSLALVPVIAITLWALRRGASTAGQNRLRPLTETRPAWWNYPLALLTPLTASLVYPGFYDAGTGIPTEDITFLLLVLGTGLLIAGWVRPLIRAGGL